MGVGVGFIVGVGFSVGVGLSVGVGVGVEVEVQVDLLCDSPSHQPPEGRSDPLALLPHPLPHRLEGQAWTVITTPVSE